jgi:SagB-type dehydrogenase family enzyme
MNDKTRYIILRQREIMKGYTSADVNAEDTDQMQELPPPQMFSKPKCREIISLPLDFRDCVSERGIADLLAERKSLHDFSPVALTMEELSFLLWATQGMRSFAGKEVKVSYRNVPSAGSRHPLETYMFIDKVIGLKSGLYHYLPMGHMLQLLEEGDDYREELAKALCDQEFALEAAVVFVWSAVPYRTEWRYGLKAAKYIMIDAGAVLENLYLAGEAVGCGTCALGAYDQELLDELLGFMPGPSAEPGYEFSLLAAAVGKRRKRPQP